MQLLKVKRKNLLSIIFIVLFTLCFSLLAINQLEGIEFPDDVDTISAAEDLLAADLQISKNDGGVTVAAGDTITYTIVFNNSSGAGASNVVLTETVPANSTFRPEASTAGWNCTPNNDAENICTLSIGDVAGGNGGQVDFAVKIDKPLAAGVTHISNIVEIGEDGTGSDPNPGNNFGADITPLALPDLQVKKDDGGMTVAAGGVITYTINFTNVSDVDAGGVVLTETVPANTIFRPDINSPDWSCVPDNTEGSTCTKSIGSVLGNGGDQIDFAVQANSQLPANLIEIVNWVAIGDDGANGSDNNAADNSDTDNTPIVRPDLQISKSDGETTAVPGEIIVYTLVYTNAGTSSASGVIITDTVPENTTFNPGASSFGWFCSPDNNAGSICTFDAGDVSSGRGGGEIDFAIEVDTSLAASVSEIINTAEIGGDSASADPNPSDNSDTDTTPIGVADLFLTKSVDDSSPFVGDTIDFTIRVMNDGPGDATNVSVLDPMPDGYDYIQDNGNGAYDNTSGVWTIANVLKGDSTSLSIVAEVLATGTYTNYAQVAASDQLDLDSTPGDNSHGDDDDDTASILPKPSADLELIKLDSPNPVIAGELLTYTLIITNHGPSAVQGIVVTDTLPLESVIFESASDVCDFTYPQPVSCALVDELVAGASVELSIVVLVKPLVTGLLTNEAEVGISGQQIDRDPENNNKTVFTSVVRQGDLLLSKEDGIDPVVAGNYLTYTVSISNAGPSGVTDVVLVDTLPSEVAFISATTSQGECDENDGVLTCTLGDFAALDKVDVEYVVHVGSATTPGPIYNEAIVDGDGANQGIAIEDTLVKSEADLSFTKTVNSNQVTSGDNLTYTLEVVNDGPSMAGDVQIWDDLPQGTSIISTTVSDGNCKEDGTFSCDLGDLAVKDQATITIVVRVDLVGPGLLENAAGVDSQTTDPISQNNNGATSTFVAKRIYFYFLPVFRVPRIFGEPNNQCVAAASITVNHDHHFLPEDQHDWYQFDLPSSGELIVKLSNFVPQKGQLTLYRGKDCFTSVFIGMDGDIATTKTVKLGNQPVGRYYIYVSNDAAPSTEPYLLRAYFEP